MAIIQDGKVNYLDNTVDKKNAVQAVGNLTIQYWSPVLANLQKSAPSKYTGITNGGIYLTGFKLESMIVSASQQIDNARVVPLINGDSITLTNICKCGVLSFSATRVTDLNGGDCVSIFDFVRGQGDVGGKLQIDWMMNGKKHTIIFVVCIKSCPPLALAGNDVADYPIQLTYSDYTDSDSPAYNKLLGSEFIKKTTDTNTGS